MLPDVTTLAIATLALLGFGTLVLAAFAQFPPTAKPAREAFPILLTEIAIVGTAVTAFALGEEILTIAILILIWRVSYEAAVVSSLRSVIWPEAWASGILVLIVATAILPLWSAVLGWCVFGVAVGLVLWKDPAHGLGNISLFPTVPLAVFSVAALNGTHSAWLLLAFLLVETFDSYALLGGKLIGRTKAFPVLSPRKTREGLLSGAAMLMLTAAVGAWLLKAPILAAIGLAALTAPLAVIGDLAASRIKRANGVKDFPQVLPLQGGLLDITDAWLLVGAGFVVISLLV